MSISIDNLDRSFADCFHENDALHVYACQGRFPFKTAAGPCALCRDVLKLIEAGAVLDDPRIVELKKNHAQCQGCGAHGKNGFMKLIQVNEKPVCPRCVERDGFQDPARIQKERELSDATYKRFKQAPLFKAPLPPVPLRDSTNLVPVAGRGQDPIPGWPGAKPPQGPADILTSDGLAAARASLAASYAQRQNLALYHVQFIPTVLGGAARLSRQLPTISLPVEPTEFLPDITAKAIEVVNLSWIKTPCSQGRQVIVEEVELRLPGNKALVEGTTNMQIDAFHRFYTNETNKGIYVLDPTKRARNSNGKSVLNITFTMGILIDAFETRISGGPHSTRGKRNASLTSMTLPTSKRPRGESILSSQVFSRIGKAAPDDTGLVAPITFEFAKILVQDSDGHVDILWEQQSENSDAISGYITLEPFSKGASKLVYKLNYGGGSWVAKCFKNVDASGLVSPAENHKAIKDEVKNIKAGQWLLARFLAHVDNIGAEIYRDFEFTQASIIRELGRPRKLSSQGKGGSGDGNDSGGFDAVWLVEPLRARQVVKFSGTLDHPAPKTPAAETMYAFVHFVYELSKGELVYADLQGTPSRVNERDGYCLFDPMVHTPEGGNSVGDHGKDGINAWKAQHVCGRICKVLGLKDIVDAASDVRDGLQDDDSD